MCNDHDSLFADLEDSSEWDGSKPEKATTTKNPHVEEIGDVAIPGFVENCPKCNGRGTFVGYTGRIVGDCFKCKGTGKLQFKTSPEARAKARASAQKRKQRSQAENVEAFKAQYPAEARWLISNSDGNTFADSLRQGVEKYGSLTEKQLAAVRKAIARDADAAEGFEAWAAENEAIANWLTTESDNGNEFAASLLNAVKRYGSLTERQEAAVRKNLDKAKEFAPSDLDLSGLKGYYAVPDGDTRLKVCIRHKGKNSSMAGWIFVDDGAAYGSRQTYGKQAPGGTYAGKIQDQLRAILANPLEAQIAYGKLTETCGYCGRKLEDPESVAAGIGPICAAKYS